MSQAAIPNIVLGRNTAEVLVTVSFTEDGAHITAGSDDRMLLIVKNTSAEQSSELTIEKGDGIFAASEDLTAQIAASDTVVLNIEGGKYVKTLLPLAGKIVLSGPEDLAAACVVLP